MLIFAMFVNPVVGEYAAGNPQSNDEVNELKYDVGRLAEPGGAILRGVVIGAASDFADKFARKEEVER